MTDPTNGYPPPVPLRPHQRSGQPHGDWLGPASHPISRGPAQQAGYPDSSLAPQAALGAKEPARTAEASEAVRRLRQHLRDTLGTELPQRVDAQQRRTGSAVTKDARRELARAVLDDAVRAHSENELMANRSLVGRDVEQRVITEVINELFGMAGLQPLLDDPTIETINVNRFDRVFVQYNDGRRAQVAPIAASNEELTDLVRMLAARAVQSGAPLRLRLARGQSPTARR